ncbi:MAG: hypothetical protein LBD42_09105 [Desulfovibrio sp.]|jgi:hypothetical protein|nr:hypothetical protein [Desulfovibrio sp.]
MKKILTLTLLLMLAGCAQPVQTNLGNQKTDTVPALERNKIIYIAIPVDLGDRKDDYLERIPGSGNAMAAALKDALAPYAAKIIMGKDYGENKDSAKKNAITHGARYMVMLYGGGYYRRPILWQSSECGVGVKLLVTELNSQEEEGTFKLGRRVYSARGQYIPVDDVVHKMIPLSLNDAIKELFDTRS